jgi:acyl-CoA reductase-like NAD-dependent aldehyde dehydrogenase
MLRSVLADPTDDLVVNSPKDGREILRIRSAGQNAVDEVCMRARSAQQSWATLPVAHRAKVLRTMRAALIRRSEELIAILEDESGKVRAEAITLEIAVAALNLTYAAKVAADALAPERIKRFVPLPRRATRLFRPRGVTGLISPFNYTIAIPMATIAPSLVAGNAVVWKPSEQGILAARKLREIFVDAGLPRDLLSLVEGDSRTGRALLDAPIDHVTFIGSTDAGRYVASRCGERLLPCILELGGNAPAIVLDDADVERTARAIVYGGIANMGASCIAVEKVFAEPRIFDHLMARTAELAGALRPGVDLGSLAMEAHKRRVDMLIAQAKVGGARVVVGGDATRPTILDCTASPSADIIDVEIFGPVIPFVRLGGDEAVRRANAHALQLNAYVFGGSRERTSTVARSLAAPNVVINDAMTNYAMMELPFGGTRASGFGRVHGIEGLRALCDEQIVVDGHLPITREPWWQPYDSRFLDRVMRGLSRILGVFDRTR